jgi:hypothetical protein
MPNSTPPTTPPTIAELASYLRLQIGAWRQEYGTRRGDEVAALISVTGGILREIDNGTATQVRP